MPWLSEEQLRGRGLRSAGRDVQIDASVEIFGSGAVSIGSHVRIDCFAVITAGPEPVTIGDHVHVGVGVCLFGTAGITLADFTSIASHTALYSTNDDYVEGHLTGPTVPLELRSVDAAPIAFGRHVVVGANCVVLPGVQIDRGAAVGALSLVASDVPEGAVVAGVTARVIGSRDVGRLERLEARLDPSLYG